MGGALHRYRELRDFAVTPEPAGAAPPLPAEGDRFVIHEHDATRLHWDLRLEHDGVLASWALPRGVPWTPEEDRLAVRTEDHPLEYLEFHGDIPEGEYGAGRMAIWDRGRYAARRFEDRKVVVELDGQRVQGAYALFTMRDGDWLIHRMDPPQDPQRELLPAHVAPMSGVTGALPSADTWAYEIHWVGARAMLTNDAGRIRVAAADGTELTARFPEIRRLGRQLTSVESVLDAVIVAVDRDGQPTHDPEPVAHRLDVAEATDALVRDRPVAAMLVDLLWLEGHPATDLPYDERRALLEELELKGPAWQTPGAHRGDGSALLATARSRGVAGIVAKRRTSPYRPGEVSDAWVHVH